MRDGKMAWVIFGFLIVESMAGGATRISYPSLIQVPELGCEFALPAGFADTGAHEEFHEAKGPGAKIQVRLYKSARTPMEAMDLSFEHRQQATSNKGKASRDFSLNRHDPFVTASGLHGMRAFFGRKPGDDSTPREAVYYFSRPSGGVIAVSVRPLAVKKKEKPAAGEDDALDQVDDALMETFVFIGR